MTRTRRHAELRQLLLDHRAALEAEVQARLRAGRDAHPPEGRDDIRGERSFALPQITADALAANDAAAVRLSRAARRSAATG